MDTKTLMAFLSRKTKNSSDDIYDIIDEIFRICGKSKSGKIEYYDIPCSFDIETSSFYENGEKRAIMYVWQFCFGGQCIMGRTWEEFVDFLGRLTLKLKLNKMNRLIVYCHSLSYEFQFMRKWLEWDVVFPVSERQPGYALTTGGIEFRCSLLLSGMKLETLAKSLNTDILKMVGDLDYNKIRHSGTPLTEKEMVYCLNDVKIIVYYINEKIKEEGGIATIPMTKTGYVRRLCRNNCLLYNNRSYDYRFVMQHSIITDVNEYRRLKQGFCGGYTHSNPLYFDKVVKNVKSYDLTSSYPTVMIAEKFPIGTGEKVDISNGFNLQENIDKYCCLFVIEIENVQSKIIYDYYISESRCRYLTDKVVCNGRIVSASHLVITVTDIDFKLINKCYNFENLKISDFYRYKKGYLPTEFVSTILDLYESKTKLKDVPGKEKEYALSKELLNSCYGMSVTDIIRDISAYVENEWIPHHYTENEILSKIMKYNRNYFRFLCYQWGVWVTAYARRNLWSAIIECKTDYIYSDTDSVKIVNYEKHEAYFNKYNEIIQRKLEEAVITHGISVDKIRPKNAKGKVKPLGIWSDEGVLNNFKTLGAKRYMYTDHDGLHTTIAGLGKKEGVKFFGKYKNPYNKFKDGCHVPADKTGKLTHTYIDDEKRGGVVDYFGNPKEYYEKSCVHMENADFTLGIAEEFKRFCLGIYDTDNGGI